MIICMAVELLVRHDSFSNARLKRVEIHLTNSVWVTHATNTSTHRSTNYYFFFER